MNTLSIFPFTPRASQQHILDFLKKLQKNQHLIFTAANGVGKTVTALSSAIAYRNSLGLEGEEYKIVYLGRTNSQADRMIDELIQIQKSSKTEYLAMSKRGKESMCNNLEIREYSKVPFLSRCESAKKLNKCSLYSKYKRLRDKPTITEIRDNLLFLPMYAEDIIDEATVRGCVPQSCPTADAPYGDRLLLLPLPVRC